MTAEEPAPRARADAADPRSSDGVSVRPAAAADLAGIAHIDGLSDSTRRSLARDLERSQGAAAEVVVLAAVAATDHLGARPAGDEGEVIGVAIGQVLHDEGHVLDLAVAPEARGRGTGQRLLEDLCAALTERGAVAHTLEVRPGNLAALALYRAAGFAVEGRRPRYYPDGEDALLLWRRDEERRR